MEQDSRELLTVEQAAQYLQISQSSIRSYIRQGMLKAFRIAGKRKVLIPRTELLALLEPARNDAGNAVTDGADTEHDTLTDKAPPADPNLNNGRRKSGA